jgi:hypothetical protein
MRRISGEVMTRGRIIEISAIGAIRVGGMMLPIGTNAVRMTGIFTAAPRLSMPRAPIRCGSRGWLGGGWMGTLHNRRVNTGEGAVTIGSRNIDPAHHHFIHEQVSTPAQQLRAFLYVAAVARRIIVDSLCS